MELPSGRAISYPEARLVDGKFEDTTDIAFKDNAMGKWREVTEWHGTFCENSVQAVARDLLAAALVRLEAAGFEVIAHVHDEAIAEIAEGEDRQAATFALISSSERVSLGASFRQAPTLPPNPRARSAVLPMSRPSSSAGVTMRPRIFEAVTQ